MGNFDKILDAVIDYLGHYDRTMGNIELYDVPNDDRVLTRIKKSIEAITPRFKFIVLSPKDKYTNIKILDIDL